MLYGAKNLYDNSTPRKKATLQSYRNISALHGVRHLLATSPLRQSGLSCTATTRPALRSAAPRTAAIRAEVNPPVQLRAPLPYSRSKQRHHAQRAAPVLPGSKILCEDTVAAVVSRSVVAEGRGRLSARQLRRLGSSGIHFVG
jgi:hypothetical protein